MKRTKRRMTVCTVLLICNLVFIWGNSLLPAEVSGQISSTLKALLDGDAITGVRTAAVSAAATDALARKDAHTLCILGDGLLRKCAHFAEFGALGLLLGWLFGMLGKKQLPAFALGVAAACIDETIQIFVPGRSPGIRDVCIDSCGAAAGMLLLFLGHAYWKKRFTRNNFRRK